jgi:hypothetical protein
MNEPSHAPTGTVVSRTANPSDPSLNVHAAPRLPSQLQQTHSGNSRWGLYVGGKHIGRDPDAFIRSQLMSDPMQGGNDAGGGE